MQKRIGILNDREKYYQLEEENYLTSLRKIEEETGKLSGIYNSQNNELIKNKELSDQISQEIKIVKTISQKSRIKEKIKEMKLQD